MFSKSCEYALKIMIYLGSRENGEERIGLREIAKSIKSPVAFTAKILQHLVKHRLLISMKGRNGGFSIPPGKTISLMDVVAVVDGEHIDRKCVLGFHECSGSHPCAVHHLFADTRDQLAQKLSNTYIHNMKEELDKELIFLTG